MQVIFLLTCVFLISLCATRVWIALANRFGCLDFPNARSLHLAPVPRGGGIAIGIGVASYLLLEPDASLLDNWYLIVGGLGLLLLGLIDDFGNVHPGLKLLVHLVATALTWPSLLQLPGWELAGGVNLTGSALALLFVVFIVWWINLFNFMDGIDGLAATEAVFLCFGTALIVLLVAPQTFDMTIMVVGVAVCGFLVFNWSPARVFMGDAGSYLVAFSIVTSWLLLLQHSEVSLWAILILPATFVVDSSTTLLGRLVAGSVWYHPHRTHGYQLLAQHWNSHAKVVTGNLVLNVVWVLPLALVAALIPALGALLFLLAWSPLVILIVVIRRRFANGV